MDKILAMIRDKKYSYAQIQIEIEKVLDLKNEDIDVDKIKKCFFGWRDPKGFSKMKRNMKSRYRKKLKSKESKSSINFWLGALFLSFFSCGEVSDCFTDYMECKRGTDSKEVKAICYTTYNKCKNDEEGD